jgi:GTPase SAR1 family protein
MVRPGLQIGFKSLLKKPIIVGGIGLSALLWGWQGIHGPAEPWSQWSLWGLSGLGLLIWRWRRSRNGSTEKQWEALTPAVVEAAIANVEAFLARRRGQAPDLPGDDLAEKLTALKGEPPLPTVLNGIILGEKRTGKTSLLNLLPSQLTLTDANNAHISLTLNWQAIAAEMPMEEMEELMVDAHWVLVLATGDLTGSQWQRLEFLQQNHHHWQLLFNKQDMYTEGDRQTVWDQLQHQMGQLANANPVLPISTAPQPIQIRRHQPDGQVIIDQENPPPNLRDLLTQLEQRAEQQRNTMALAVQWRQCQSIQRQIQQRWRENRRALALPLVEQAQWLAAGTALVNPVANLDLLTAIAINSQLVWDLTSLYHQKMSLAQSKAVAKEMGEVLIKLGMVELSTQALGTLLKSQPLTYLAGGALQGISAAYLTRIAGLSLISFLESQDVDLSEAQWDWSKLTTVVKQTFEQNQRLAVLQGFMQSARQQFASPKPPRTAVELA